MSKYTLVNLGYLCFPGKGGEAVVAVPDDAGGGDGVRHVVVPEDVLGRLGDLLLRRHRQGSPNTPLRRVRRSHQSLLQVREKRATFDDSDVCEGSKCRNLTDSDNVSVISITY